MFLLFLSIIYCKKLKTYKYTDKLLYYITMGKISMQLKGKVCKKKEKK